MPFQTNGLKFKMANVIAEFTFFPTKLCINLNDSVSVVLYFYLYNHLKKLS